MAETPHHDPALPVAPESRRRVALQNPLAPQRPVDIDIALEAFQNGLVLRTCPQCGANPAAGRTRNFTWVNPWLYLTLCAGFLVFLIVVLVARVSATGWLPLCAECQRADQRARSLAALSVAGVFLGPLVFGIAGSAFDAGAIAAAIGFVAGLVGAVTAQVKLAPQIVACKKIDKGVIRLRAAPTWRAVLAEEQPEAIAR